MKPDNQELIFAENKYINETKENLHYYNGDCTIDVIEKRVVYECFYRRISTNDAERSDPKPETNKKNPCYVGSRLVI